ncbi:MAG: acyl-CoA thioesterase [Hyphomicrobiaceae bacterium]|nr:MAG: acyl-CoA thioesterase [Hyphomicrobiaceae bacterium]
MSGRPPPEQRSAYPHFLEIPTRWNDNDSYRHVNNAVYYEYFDTVVNRFLIDNDVLDVERSAVIAVVAETHCRFFSQIAFPSQVHAGLRIAHLGTSSIRYEIGLFRDDERTASAQGHFVHVCVDRGTSRPVPVPRKLKDLLGSLMVSQPTEC